MADIYRVPHTLVKTVRICQLCDLRKRQLRTCYNNSSCVDFRLELSSNYTIVLGIHIRLHFKYSKYRPRQFLLHVGEVNYLRPYIAQFSINNIQIASDRRPRERNTRYCYLLCLDILSSID